MELREILLVLHIAAAGIWLGANVVQGLVPSLAARQSPQAVAGWYRVTADLSTKLYMPVGILLAATGIWLVLENDSFSFSSVFVSIGFATIIVGALLGKFVFETGAERAALAVESGEKGAIKSAAGRLAAFGTVDTLLVLFTIVAMVIKLGA